MTPFNTTVKMQTCIYTRYITVYCFPPTTHTVVDSNNDENNDKSKDFISK